MTLEEAIKEFGNSNRLCVALKIHRQSIRQWRKQGFIAHKHQLKIQELTNNRLIASADSEIFDREEIRMIDNDDLGKADFDLLVFCAFRYALGRKTYVVSQIARLLIERKNEIYPPTKTKIRQEIIQAIENNEAGMSCDVSDWKKVLKEFEQ